MFGDVFVCGCMVEKYTITEINREFAKIDDFVKCRAILVWFTEKMV